MLGLVLEERCLDASSRTLTREPQKVRRAEQACMQIAWEQRYHSHVLTEFSTECLSVCVSACPALPCSSHSSLR